MTGSNDKLNGVLDAADVTVDSERAVSVVVGKSGMTCPKTRDLLLVPEGL